MRECTERKVNDNDGDNCKIHSKERKWDENDEGRLYNFFESIN